MRLTSEIGNARRASKTRLESKVIRAWPTIGIIGGRGFQRDWDQLAAQLRIRGSRRVHPLTLCRPFLRSDLGTMPPRPY